MGPDLGEAHDIPERHANLTGFWWGAYWYAGGAQDPQSFSAHLREDNGVLLGTTLEQLAQIGELSAQLTGARSGSSVDFIKVYDPMPGYRLHPIQYLGTVNPALSVIDGEWRIEDAAVNGGFRMTRLSGAKAAAKRELAEALLR